LYPELETAHLDGVMKLLREHLELLEERND
jgi:hypothetical protein